MAPSLKPGTDGTAGEIAGGADSGAGDGAGALAGASHAAPTAQAVPKDTVSIGAITRRAAMGAMGVGALAFMAFGPRGKAEATGGRIVLDYWEKWTGIEGRAMQKVVDDFNASQDRIFVRYFAMSGIDQKTQVAIAGNAPPDIVGLWNYNVPAFAAANAIEPLDELGVEFGVQIGNYAQGVRQVMQYPDALGATRMWAAVNTGGTLALYYNRAHFREAGLDPDRAPKTIVELDEYARACTIGTAQEGYTRVGLHQREPGWWNFIWGYQFGGSLYDEATNAATVNSPANIAAYEWLQSYTKEYGLAPMNTMRSMFGNYDSDRNGFLAGSVSMILQGPWLANMIKLYTPDLDYGVAPFPVESGLYREDEPLGLIDTDVLVIPRGVKNPRASMEFLAYTQRQEVVEFLSTVHCKGSPLAQSTERFRREHPNRGIEVFEAIARSPRGYRVPPTPVWLAIRDQMDFVVDNVWNQRGTVAEQLGRAQARASADVARDAEQRRRRAGGRVAGGKG